MKQIPNKYKKHMALVLFGLKTQEELDKDLARYGINDIHELKADILADMSSSKVPKTYLVSLIPKFEYYKLPNRVIRTEEDLEGLEDLLNLNPQVVELWKFEKENEGIIGRFLINDEEQVIEQIWSTDHREIERYNPESNIPLIRASRIGWNRRYNINVVNGFEQDKKEEAQNIFIQAVTEIERNREKIEIMLEECKKIGVNELVLEYRMDSRGFSFIDWDTSNDIKVLNKLFSKEHTDWEGR